MQLVSLVDALTRTGAASTPRKPAPAPRVLAWLPFMLFSGCVIALGVTAYGISTLNTAAATLGGVTLGAMLSLLGASIFYWTGTSHGSWSKNPFGEPVDPPQVIPPFESLDREPTTLDTDDPDDRDLPPGIGRSTPDGTQFQRRDIPYDGRYAPVRYNCFGAHWPAKHSHLFGATGYGKLRDGNRITRFPHAINGIAATISLLRRLYAGKSFREAGSIWTTGQPGTSMRGKPGWDRAGILTAAMIDEGTPEFFDFLEGLGRNEAGAQYNISRDYLRMGWEMFKAGSADAYLDGFDAAGADDAVTGEDLLELARTYIGGRYVLGARVPKDHPDYPKDGGMDCAEFVSYLIARLTGRLYGCTNNNAPMRVADAYTGSFWRDVHELGVAISVQEAAATPGAFLLRRPGRSGIGHIALSDGKGGTLEAKSTRAGIVADKIGGRHWDIGGLVPWIAYDGHEPIDVSAPATIYAIGQPNMRKAKVEEIQRALQQAGYSPGDVDGGFGPKTEAAVMKFQTARGLVIDGEVGPETAGELGVTLP